MVDRDTGRSRGFGFVDFSSSEEAQSAIEKFNGQTWAGRVLRIAESTPRPRAPRRFNQDRPPRHNNDDDDEIH